MIDFDMMLIHVGEFGLYQKILFLFQAPFCIFVTFVLFGQLFMFLYPRVYWCQEQSCLNAMGLTPEQRRNLSLPYSIENGDWDPCLTFNVPPEVIERVVNDAQAQCLERTRGNTSIPCDYEIDRNQALLTERVRRQSYGNRYQNPPSSRWRFPGSSTPGQLPYEDPTDPPPTEATTRIQFTTFGPTTEATTRVQSTTVFPKNPTKRPRLPQTAGTGRDASGGRSTRRRTTTTTTVSPTSHGGTQASTSNAASAVCTTGTTRNLILGNNTSINAESIANHSARARTFGGTGQIWTTTDCTNWNYSRVGFNFTTIVTEVGWWCNPERRITIANAVFYLGAIVGGIGIGFIADTRGRVPALVTANLLGCIGGALTAVFYTNFIVFCIFRFIAGMAFDNSFTMIYILVLEYVGPTYRTLVANLSIAVFYTMGTLILPWLFLWIGNWRIYAFTISLPMSLAIVAIFLVPESARWLLSKGRTKEATRILRSFAKVNGKKVDEKIFVEFEEGAQKLYEEFSQEEDASLWEAFKRPRILKNFLFLTVIWSLIATVYDGHSRNILNLGDNVFVSFTIASSTEFPADMLLIFTLDRFGRRWLAFGSLCLSGGFSLMSAFIPVGNMTLSLVMALISRFFVNVAFNIGLQYAAELLPTVIRAQGVNVIHIMGYVASIVSPFIASIGRTNPALSLTILGIFASIAGFLCLFLPETLGEDLPNTLDEGEAFGKNQSFWNCPICAKPRPEETIPLEPTAPTSVQRRNNMRASLRGEGFRSSIISTSSSSHRLTPSDHHGFNPGGTWGSDTGRLRRVYTQ